MTKPDDWDELQAAPRRRPDRAEDPPGPDESVNDRHPPVQLRRMYQLRPHRLHARAKHVTSGSAHGQQNVPGENRDQRSYRSWLTALLTVRRPVRGWPPSGVRRARRG